MACVPSEDSDQPGYAPSLIRIFAVCMKKHWIFGYPSSAQRRLIRLGRRPGWSVFAGLTCHFTGFVMRWLILSNCYCLKPVMKHTVQWKCLHIHVYDIALIWRLYFSYTSSSILTFKTLNITTFNTLRIGLQLSFQYNFSCIRGIYLKAGFKQEYQHKKKYNQVLSEKNIWPIKHLRNKYVTNQKMQNIKFISLHHANCLLMKVSSYTQ